MFRDMHVQIIWTEVSIRVYTKPTGLAVRPNLTSTFTDTSLGVLIILGTIFLLGIVSMGLHVNCASNESIAVCEISFQQTCFFT